MKCLPLILVLVLLATGCKRDAMSTVGHTEAERYLEHLYQRPVLAGSIRFHRQPAVGQWARYREGGTMVSWRVIAAKEHGWQVEQTIYCRGADEWVVVRYAVDDHGWVMAAEGAHGGAGRELSAWRSLPVGEPMTDDRPPLDSRTGEPVAGLTTTLTVVGPRRYWYAVDGAPFAHLLSTDGDSPGLVRSMGGGRVNRELSAHGVD